MKNLCYYFMALIVLTSCANVDKMIDRGQYDQAIDKLVNKLAGKKNKKKEEVIALEYAFKKAQDRDLRTEKSLRDENIPENWTKVYNIHNQITYRQNKIEGLLPLETQDGYQATFNFVNIDELKKESKRNSADYYYQSALSLLEESRRSGDKNAAREAYNYLNKIDALFSQYKEKEQLKKDALQLSMENYLVKINNQTNQIIPADVEAELLKWSVDGLNSKFKNFDVKANPALNYDHYILLNLNQMEFSPEREKTRIYDDVNEITKEEVVKDRNDKPRRDSLGKEIKVKVVTRYVATIEEISQIKSALVGGRLEFINVRSSDIEYTKNLQVEAVFENKMARLIKGDRSYVTDECERILKGRLVPFPSNERLLVDAVEKLKNQVKNIIKDKVN